jgi:hypothetical protein
MEYWLDTARLLIVAWNSFRRKMSRELFLTNSVFLLVAVVGRMLCGSGVK